ncbi:MAG: hypothetical protein IJM62_05130, partial [Lachnospiraceae bacterium]|nr:hypothetical protein [Lachnospiraceae bacterium]
MPGGIAHIGIHVHSYWQIDSLQQELEGCIIQILRCFKGQYLIQDDLYEAVKGEWLKTAVIPDDRPMTGGFSDLDQDVEKIMMADFKAFAEGEKKTDIPEMKYAIALYKKMLDTERRNSEGIAPVLP